MTTTPTAPISAYPPGIYPQEFDGLRLIMDRAQRGLAAVLEQAQTARTVVDASTGRTTILDVADQAFTEFFAEFAAVEAELVTLAENVVTISANDRLNPRARQQDIATAVAASKAITDEYVTTMAGILDTLRPQLEAASLPARPDGDAVAQEAALTNLRSDLRMLLDPISSDAGVLDAIVSEGERRYAVGDDLAGWFIAGSSWVEMYLRSRFGEPIVNMWTSGTRPQFVSHHVTGYTRAAADLLDIVNQPTGLAGATLAGKELAEQSLNYIAAGVVQAVTDAADTEVRAPNAEQLEAAIEAKYRRALIDARVQAKGTGRLVDPTDALTYLPSELLDSPDTTDADIDQAITTLVTERPYLATSTVPHESFGQGDGGLKQAEAPGRQLTRQDLKSMSAAAMEQAEANGQLNTLLGRW